MLKAAMLFQDGMVIQRDQAVAVWGTAEPRALVNVTIQGATAQCRSNAKGEWQVKCGPFHTSLEEEMLISSGDGAIRIREVAIGEVWLAGGQSNMEFHMRHDVGLEIEKLNCDSRIRFYDYPEVAYEGQINEAEYGGHYGFWRACSPTQLEWFSAAAYYFASNLCGRYNIPVGIVGCNWGGTPACAWMSENAIASCGGSAWLDDYDTAIAALDIGKYSEDFKSNPANYKVNEFADPMTDILLTGYPTGTILEKAAAIGITADALNPAVGPYSERRPTGLYRSMLKQVAPYTIKGVIWYQGEADDEKAELYHKMFPALIRCWRDLWNDAIPFLFVQLAPFRRWMNCTGARYPEIRAAQQWTADHVQNTAMAVITDAGCAWDIHPKNKRPVGERLALLARRYIYGDDILCEAPRMRGISVKDSQITLYFDYAGEGLRLQGDQLNSLEIYQGGYPIGYTSCQAGGNAVTVLSDEIHAGMPTEARIAWTDFYEVNLQNSAGIPARPAIVSSCP